MINVIVAKRKGNVNIVAGMNRHGTARWILDPPVMVEDGEEIAVSYGCLRADAATDQFKPAGIMPDIQICWRE